VQFVPRAEILSFEEIERFVRIAAAGRTQTPGHRRRAAGAQGPAGAGREAAAMPGHRGHRADHQRRAAGRAGAALYDAGLRRLNVHLDTLDRERFQQITRRDDFDRVLAGIDAVLAARLRPIKINAVAVKGLTEPDIVPLARFGANTASRSATSSSCRSTRRACGTATRCCWPTTSWPC
jgi:GTP 3',8-cyclase